MNPFYQQGLAQGTLTREQAEQLLQCLWVKFNNQPAPPKVGVTAAESGTYTDFAQINLGGILADRSDGVSDLSYLLLDVIEGSQNEQDTRYFADFARVICLEPANGQEAYEMTREAFDLSERFRVPVVLRLVTRLAHARSIVQLQEARPENALSKPPAPASWILLPANARRQWRALLDRQPAMREYSEHSRWNRLSPGSGASRFGVITTGIARNYFFENLEDLAERPLHLHIGMAPVPVALVREAGRACRFHCSKKSMAFRLSRFFCFMVLPAPSRVTWSIFNKPNSTTRINWLRCTLVTLILLVLVLYLVTLDWAITRAASIHVRDLTLITLIFLAYGRAVYLMADH